MQVFLHSEMSHTLRTHFHLQWWHLIHLRFVPCLGEVKFRISTHGLSCGMLSCAWLIYASLRFLVYAKGSLMLSPFWKCSWDEKALSFCNRPTVCWGDRVNICASAFFHHCLLCFFPSEHPWMPAAHWACSPCSSACQAGLCMGGQGTAGEW